MPVGPPLTRLSVGAPLEGSQCTVAVGASTRGLTLPLNCTGEHCSPLRSFFHWYCMEGAPSKTPYNNRNLFVHL